MMTDRAIRLAIAGLGGAADLVLPWIGRVEGVVLAGGADVRPEARASFASHHGVPAFASVEELCDDPGIDAVWIETPNQYHCEHAICAAEKGKHVICAKPLATTMEECDRMIAAADSRGVTLIQGHSKIFDAPIQAIRDIVASGRLGRVIAVQTLLYNDWLQRPRLAEELDPARGGGIILRQGPHLVDIATYIMGRGPLSVRATAGAWDPNFAATGNFSAHLDFGDGVAADLLMNGYGYFDSTELHWDIGAMGARKTQAGEARHRRTSVLSPDEKYGASPDPAAQIRRRLGKHPPFFGLTIISCERGVIRQSPDGLFVYDGDGRTEVPVSDFVGRSAELIELRDSLRERRAAFPDGRWARATLETCLGIARSADEGREIVLERQVALNDRD